jgi:hypothetical protein
MCHALRPLAPSLRVLFSGLAKLSFEASRGTDLPLPKIGKSKQVTRDGSTWTLTPGLVSFTAWRTMLDRLSLVGLSTRMVPLAFIYSIMCVIDGATDEGRVRERHLPFEVCQLSGPDHAAQHTNPRSHACPASPTHALPPLIKPSPLMTYFSHACPPSPPTRADDLLLLLPRRAFSRRSSVSRAWSRCQWTRSSRGPRPFTPGHS